MRCVVVKIMCLVGKFMCLIGKIMCLIGTPKSTLVILGVAVAVASTLVSECVSTVAYRMIVSIPATAVLPSSVAMST